MAIGLAVPMIGPGVPAVARAAAVTTARTGPIVDLGETTSPGTGPVASRGVTGRIPARDATQLAPIHAATGRTPSNDATEEGSARLATGLTRNAVTPEGLSATARHAAATTSRIEVTIGEAPAGTVARARIGPGTAPAAIPAPTTAGNGRADTHSRGRPAGAKADRRTGRHRPAVRTSLRDREAVDARPVRASGAPGLGGRAISQTIGGVSSVTAVTAVVVTAATRGSGPLDLTVSAMSVVRSSAMTVSAMSVVRSSAMTVSVMTVVRSSVTTVVMSAVRSSAMTVSVMTVVRSSVTIGMATAVGRRGPALTGVPGPIGMREAGSSGGTATDVPRRRVRAVGRSWALDSVVNAERATGTRIAHRGPLVDRSAPVSGTILKQSMTGRTAAPPRTGPAAGRVDPGTSPGSGRPFLPVTGHRSLSSPTMCSPLTCTARYARNCSA
jgi:hypothetical protein